MDFALACAVTQPPSDLARVARRRLERELDGWAEAHQAEAAESFSLTAGEFEADATALAGLARAVAEAGQRLSEAMAEVAASGLSTPGRVRPPTARDISERIEQALDGDLVPTAARVVGAALALELA